jgi:hypothetical protein
VRSPALENYSDSPDGFSREHTYIWHVRPYAGWLIALVTLLWLWTWVIVRGIGRVVLAAVLGEWYFHR